MFNISGSTTKSFFFTLVLCCLVFTGECQKRGMTFTEAAKSDNTIQHLDSLYWSGVHVDTSKAAFSRSLYDSIQHEYTALLKKLGKYLYSQGFKWGRQTQCFNKIYFSQTGAIELFLYQFSPGQIDLEKSQEFEKLLNEFITQNKFPLSAKRKFALCSSVMYND